MKIFSARANLKPVARQTAQGYLATNLALPGLGSLAAGRTVGLPQLALCLAGFAITLFFGVRFLYWSLDHWAEFHNSTPSLDPMKPLRDLWQQARWPLLGIGLFALSWIWALKTSWAMLAETKVEKSDG